ncbi:MAG: queuosine precursor transporter [bacterium]|nr:queuosine precursor transporter [bacterium]
MAAFVTILLCSNLIGVPKVSTVFGYTYGAGILFFPISYVFGDILTEVYGYSRSRKVIWAGFAALFFASVMSWVIVALPPAPGWTQQENVEAIFGQTPRIACASFIAYWCGEFSNSYVLAKMKIWTAGRHLWMRTIGSTIVGEGVDSLIFYPLAFVGVWTNELVVQVMIANYLIKTGLETVLTPVTYKVVGFLKRAEQEDYYDRDTNFSPFHVEV